ncbi:MAG: hypothetical protein AAF721_09385 [Myxococcota bacterium]
MKLDGMRGLGAAVLPLLSIACGPSPGSGSDESAAPSTTSSPGAESGGASSSSGPVVSTTANTTTSDGDDGVATTEAPCATWCGDGYPTNPGCDEEDDGVQVEDDGNFEDDFATGGGDDTSVGMGDDIPLGTNVYDVQQGSVPVGTLVELGSVIVTSPPAMRPDGFGAMFTVAESDGGPFSGITVRVSQSPGAIPYSPGDVLDIVGRHHERYIFSLIEAEFDGVTVTGTGSMPEPIVVPAAEIEALSVGGPDAKPLESVVVQVLEPIVIDAGACAGEIEIQASLRIDDRFLVATGQALPTPSAAGYSSVVGPLLYTYNGFEIAPRTLDDLMD